MTRAQQYQHKSLCLDKVINLDNTLHATYATTAGTSGYLSMRYRLFKEDVPIFVPCEPHSNLGDS